MHSLASTSVKTSPPAPPQGHGKSNANNNKKAIITPTRRQLLTSGMFAACMPQQPALADSDEEISYVQGPEGLEYADLTVGKGESPFEGDGKEGDRQCLFFSFSTR